MADTDVLDIEQILDRVEGLVPRGPREWMCKCPAHEDKNASLSICELDDGSPLIHCFAGCSYGAILEALEVAQPKPVTISFTSPPLKDLSKSGLGLWAELFQFDHRELDPFFVGGIERHLSIEADRIEFLWPGMPSAVKYRLSNPGETKGYLWGKNSPHPPIWPQLEEQLEEEIYLTEGESDCIVLRRAGLPAYAITTGGSKSTLPRFPTNVIRALIERGVRTIYLAFDDDDVGHNTAAVVYNQILAYEKMLPLDQIIDVRVLRVNELALSFLGEKDLRQVWLRVRDPEAFSDGIRAIKEDADTDSPATKLWDHWEYINRPVADLQWIVKDVVQAGGIGWISGYPKRGKSWIALDLAFAIATGDPFLKRFEVLMPGDVIYVVKENSDSSTVGRIKKILGSKKSGFSVSMGGKEVDIELENRVMIDASRDFYFEPQAVEALIQKALRHIKRTGRPIRAIIIDPLSFSLPKGKFDLNSFADFQKYVVDLVAHITRRTGAAVLVVHHQNKSDDNNTMLGSVAAEASYDNKIMFLTKAKDHVPGDPVRIQIEHRDGQAVVFDLQIKIDDHSYETIVTDVDVDDLRENAGMNVKVSFVDKQKRYGSMIKPLLIDLPEEFQYRDYVDVVRSQYGEDDISASLVENVFKWLKDGQEGPPVIEQHKKGWYRLFKGPQA